MVPVCPVCGSRGWENFKVTGDDDLPPEAECLQCKHQEFVGDILKEVYVSGLKLRWLMVVSGVIGLLLWIPVTRMVILAILPLGYKADDILVFALLIFGVVMFFRGWGGVLKLINSIKRGIK